MHCFFAIDLICLNFRTVEMLLNFLEADHVLVHVFADLQAAVEAVRRHAMLAEPDVAVDAEYVLLILPQVVMRDARAEEVAPQQRAQPTTIRRRSLLSIEPATYHLLGSGANPARDRGRGRRRRRRSEAAVGEEATIMKKMERARL